MREFFILKESKDNLRFWVPYLRFGFQIPGNGFWISMVSGIPDFNRKWGSRFLELNSRFQIPGFPIPQAKSRWNS